MGLETQTSPALNPSPGLCRAPPIVVAVVVAVRCDLVKEKHRGLETQMHLESPVHRRPGTGTWWWTWPFNHHRPSYY